MLVAAVVVELLSAQMMRLLMGFVHRQEVSEKLVEAVKYERLVMASPMPLADEPLVTPKDWLPSAELARCILVKAKAMPVADAMAAEALAVEASAAALTVATAPFVVALKQVPAMPTDLPLLALTVPYTLAMAAYREIVHITTRAASTAASTVAFMVTSTAVFVAQTNVVMLRILEE